MKKMMKIISMRWKSFLGICKRKCANSTIFNNSHWMSVFLVIFSSAVQIECIKTIFPFFVMVSWLHCNTYSISFKLWMRRWLSLFVSFKTSIDVSSCYRQICHICSYFIFILYKVANYKIENTNHLVDCILQTETSLFENVLLLTFYNLYLSLLLF